MSAKPGNVTRRHVLGFIPLPPNRRSRERTLLLSAVVLPALILLLGGFLQRWVGDDGFINVRVARQLLAGNGFVFNAGERSEAVTSPLWVLLLSLVGQLGMRLEDAAWSLGLLLTVVGVVASGLGGLMRCEAPSERARVVLPFGLLFYACLPPAWDYATSGLENGLGIAFLGLSHWLVARAATGVPTDPRRTYLAALVLSAAAIVRPDYALFALPLLGYLCWRSQGTWRRLGVAATGVSVGAAYQIFRMGYFAALVPNTALAKEAFEPRWGQGLRYFWNSAGLYWLLVPIAGVLGLLVLRWTRQRPPSAALGPLLAAAGVLHLLYVVRVGGDFMHARLLLPGLFCLFSATPFLDLHELWARRKPLAVATLALAYGWCFLCTTQLRVAKGNEFGIGDERGWHARKARVQNPTRLEHYRRFAFHRAATKTARQLTKHCPGFESTTGRARSSKPCKHVLIPRRGDGALRVAPPGGTLPLDKHSVPPDVVAVVAQRPLGIASNVLGLRVNVVDYFGLADPLASRLAVGKRLRPGHEKAFDTRWLSARYAAPGATKDAGVLAAKRALECGALADLTRATRGPLGARGFLRNLVDAFRFHGLRIPKNPRAAKKAFCKRSH